MSADSKPETKPNYLRRFFSLLLAFSVICLFGWVFRVRLLRGAAHFWVINDSPAKADAIIVLGGGVDTRPFTAAQLYKRGVATKVLIMAVRTNAAALLGLTPSETTITRKILLTNGVPESAIIQVGHGVTSTFDETAAVREWASTNHVDTLIIATDLFHTRRARWVFRHAFKGSPINFLMEPVPSPDYNSENWWLHEEGLIAFQNELIKSIYYHLRY